MKRWLIGTAVVAVLGVALVLFEPWTLWTDTTVDEALPSVTVTATGTAPAPTPTDLAVGEFVSQEHETSGTARVVALPDGSRVVRLEGFETSNGPDLHVWLSAAEAGGSWFKYDEQEYIALGELKGNQGDQNYEIPADADLADIHSVVIWCDRFDVAFGSAPLALG